MKKKAWIVSVIIMVAVLLVLVMFACKPPKPTGPQQKVNILNPLPDLVDVGDVKTANIYIKKSAIQYAADVKKSQSLKLANKQNEERKKHVEDGKEWENGEYYSFTTPYFKQTTDPNNESGYIYEWQDSNENTVTKIFCYSSPDEIIDVMSRAAMDQPRMVKLVEYITRNDDYYNEKLESNPERYPIEKGKGSSILDYKNIDDLQDINNNFDAKKDKDHKYGGQDKHFWSNLLKLKQRKINAEIFAIFEDKPDMFSRFQIENNLYSLQVLSYTMIPAYEKALADTKEYDGKTLKEKYHLVDLDSPVEKRQTKLQNYMREELFDFAGLASYLSFIDLAKAEEKDKQWEINDRFKPMTLYGYTYQYEKRAHEVFDDNRKVNSYGEMVTEYEDYLNLSNTINDSYFQNHDEALRYNAYNRRKYAKSYRYTTAFYQKYYNAQLGYQDYLADNERAVYKTLNMTRPQTPFELNGGLPIFKNGVKYTAQIKKGLNIGLDGTLKISDVDWQYTGDDYNVRRMNKANMDYKSTEEKDPDRPLYRVLLNVEQLKTQIFMLESTYLNDSERKNALRNQIYSTDADYIKGLHDNYKEQVVKIKEIERFFRYCDFKTSNAEYTLDEDTFAGYNTENHEQELFDTKIEDLGRIIAMEANLREKSFNCDAQIAQVQNADFRSIQRELKDTVAIDYKKYHERETDQSVDEYFEDTLIKRIYVDPITGQEYPKPERLPATDTAPSRDTEKRYDTNHALSRLLNNHEEVLRHMAGRVQVQAMSVADYTKYKDVNQPDNYEYSSQLINDIEGVAYDSKNYQEAILDGGKEIWIIIEGRKSENKDDKNKQDKENLITQPLGPGQDKPASGEKNTFIFKGTKYTFDDWCVDKALKYVVKNTDKFRFDIKLYPRFIIENGVNE